MTIIADNSDLETGFDGTVFHRDLGGQFHCEDGPAIIWGKFGGEEWRFHGRLHREGGPATTYSDGSELWYRWGLLHREDGPAVIYPSGETYWYLDGERVDPIVHFVKMKDFA